MTPLRLFAIGIVASVAFLYFGNELLHLAQKRGWDKAIMVFAARRRFWLMGAASLVSLGGFVLIFTVNPIVGSVVAVIAGGAAMACLNPAPLPDDRGTKNRQRS